MNTLSLVSSARQTKIWINVERVQAHIEQRERESNLQIGLKREMEKERKMRT